MLQAVQEAVETYQAQLADAKDAHERQLQVRTHDYQIVVIIDDTIRHKG